MRPAELSNLAASRSEAPCQLSVERELLDLPWQHVVCVDVLRWPRSDAEGVRPQRTRYALLIAAEIRDRRLETCVDGRLVLDLAHVVEIVVEHLNSRVPPIRDVDESFGVDGDAVRCVELARASATCRTSELDDIAVLVELVDVGVLVAVADEDVPLGVPCDVGRLVEVARPRRRHLLLRRDARPADALADRFVAPAQ